MGVGRGLGGEGGVGLAVWGFCRQRPSVLNLYFLGFLRFYSKKKIWEFWEGFGEGGMRGKGRSCRVLGKGKGMYSKGVEKRSSKGF